jgi:hypothetical protein
MGHAQTWVHLGEQSACLFEGSNSGELALATLSECSASTGHLASHTARPVCILATVTPSLGMLSQEPQRLVGRCGASL